MAKPRDGARYGNLREMAGALTLARSVALADPKLSDEILEAARAQTSAIADTSRP